MKPLWTQQEAIDFCASLWKHLEPVGIHVGLTGSVLTKGHSFKDLDLILYPRRTDIRGFEDIEDQLVQFMGLRRILGQKGVRRIWRELGSLDLKRVEAWRDGEGRRIDFFFLQ